MTSNHPFRANSVSFGEKLAASGTFDALFRNGMALVEETASYLDGAGRDESRYLSRVAALTYASESMRLTRRLMQIAAWLLLQRAVNEGEMTQHDAASDKHRSRNAWEAVEVRHSTEELPASLTMLIEKSVLLQERVQRLDAALGEPTPLSDASFVHPLESQLALIRSAFPG